jgi:hypothetical protein
MSAQSPPEIIAIGSGQTPASVFAERLFARADHGNESKSVADSHDDETIQLERLSEVLSAEIASRGSPAGPFWNQCALAISKRSWMPPLLNSIAVDAATSSAGSSANLTENSLYSTPIVTYQSLPNAPTTYSKLTMTAPAIEVPKIVTRKLRIYPTPQQFKFFQQCFGAHRYFYNKALSYVNALPAGSSARARSFHSVRDAIFPSLESVASECPWVWDVPFETCAEAIHAFCTAYDTNLKTRGKGHFVMRKLTKKDDENGCHFVKQALLKGFRIAPKRLDA